MEILRGAIAHKGGNDDDKKLAKTTTRGDSKRRLDEEGELVRDISGLSGLRRTCGEIAEMPRFHHFIHLVIVGNAILVVHETNVRGHCDTIPSPPDCLGDDIVVRLLNVLLLGIYSFEIILKAIAFQQKFFESRSDCFDGLIVILAGTSLVAELFSLSLPGFGILRLFRLARLGRAMKLTLLFEELRVLVYGMGSAFRAILFGTVLIVIFVFLWSIIGVVLVNPINQQLANEGAYEDCHRCVYAYSSVQSTMLTMLQTIIMGDDWGTYAIKILEVQPLLTIYFVSAQFSIQLGLVNLILSVIVDKALAGFKKGLQAEASAHKAEVNKAKEALMEMCKELDTDESGSLSYEELIQGFKEQDLFHDTCVLLDISETELHQLFTMVDADGSGFVSPKDFADAFYGVQDMDVRHMCMSIKFQISRGLSQGRQGAAEMALSLDGMNEKVSDLCSPDRLVERFGKVGEDVVGAASKEDAEARLPSVQEPNLSPLRELMDAHLKVLRDSLEKEALEYNARVLSETNFRSKQLMEIFGGSVGSTPTSIRQDKFLMATGCGMSPYQRERTASQDFASFDRKEFKLRQPELQFASSCTVMPQSLQRTTANRSAAKLTPL